MTYTRTYHAACNELIAHGASKPERANNARRLISRALWELRKQYASERARRERYHMLFISGHFPDRVQS